MLYPCAHVVYLLKEDLLDWREPILGSRWMVSTQNLGLASMGPVPSILSHSNAGHRTSDSTIPPSSTGRTTRYTMPLPRRSRGFLLDRSPSNQSLTMERRAVGERRAV